MIYQGVRWFMIVMVFFLVNLATFIAVFKR